MTLDVDLDDLTTIATTLEQGSDGLEGLAGTVPAGVQAGPMTAVIASMISQITNSAGNVSDSMAGAAELVRLSRRYYLEADASADAGLTQIEQAMKQ